MLGAGTISLTDMALVIEMNQAQTLSFLKNPGAKSHADLETLEAGLSNNGVHISLYVADLPTSYRRAQDLGVTFVNHRFSRQAVMMGERAASVATANTPLNSQYTLEEAVDQCMFRVLDIVDPEDPTRTPILQLVSRF